MMFKSIFECGKFCRLLSEVQQNKGGEISKWARPHRWFNR